MSDSSESLDLWETLIGLFLVALLLAGYVVACLQLGNRYLGGNIFLAAAILLFPFLFILYAITHTFEGAFKVLRKIRKKNARKKRG